MNKRHYEHTLPNIRGSLSNTYNKRRTLHYPFERIFESKTEQTEQKCTFIAMYMPNYQQKQHVYPLLHRNGIVQTLQNLLVRIIYHGIVQRIQVNKRSPFAAVSHPRTDDGNRYVVVACGGSPAVARRI